jgi:hypothetical protein
MRNDSGIARPSALAVVKFELPGFNATTRNLAEIVQKVAQIMAHGTAASLFVSFTKHPIN